MKSNNSNIYIYIYIYMSKIFVQIGTNNGNDRFIQLVKNEKPDMVILVEPNKSLLDEIKKTTKE